MSSAKRWILACLVVGGTLATTWMVLQFAFRIDGELASQIAAAVAGVLSLPMAAWAAGQLTREQPPPTKITPSVIQPEIDLPVTEEDPIVGDDLGTTRSRYLSRIRKRYRSVDMEILTPMSQQDEFPAVPLSDIFVGQVVKAGPRPMELPRELVQRLIDNGLAEARDLPDGITRTMLNRIRESYQQQPSMPVLPLIAGEEGARLVLLGDPGSGKSTLARYIAYSLSAVEVRGALEPLAGWLPVIIELREYALHGGNFIDFLSHLHLRQGIAPPPELLNEHLDGDGRIVMIFDGLDEIFDAQARDQMAKHIANIAARYPAVRIIVTSRTIDYQKNVLEAEGFRRHQLQDLDRAQIATFVDQWYRIAYPDNPAEAVNLGRRLMTAISRTPAIGELAGNPMLLTILAIIGRRRQPPGDRVSVYAQAVTVLVEQWDPRKFLPTAESGTDTHYINARDKMAMLRLVARAMQDSPAGLSGNFISGGELQHLFAGYLEQRDWGRLLPAQARRAADTIVQQFRKRNFILSNFGNDVYGFVHRSFLEYLAAYDIEQRFNFTHSITDTELIDGIFGQRWRDPAWHEVLLLTAGMLDGRFVNRAVIRMLGADPHWAASNLVEPHHLLLAIRCIGEVHSVSLLAEACELAIDEVIRMLPVAHRRVTRAYNDALNREIERSVLPVFAGITPWPGRERYLAWYTGNGLIETDDEVTGDIAARLAVILLSDSEELLAFLRTQASHGWSAFQRMAAVSALAQAWHADADVMSLIRERAATDADHEVRLRAMREAERARPGDPETLALLRDLATNDQHLSVRTAAVRAIADGRTDRPGALALLHEFSIAETHREIRATVVRAIADGWPYDPGTLPLLRQVAAAAEHDDVRRAAVQSIVALRPADPQTRLLLRDRIANDTSTDVRQLAVKALATGWPQDRDSLPLLHSLATDDQQEGIRQVAVRAIADGWREDPGTLPMLLARTGADSSPDVRQAAVQAMARGWHGRPELLPVLRERAMTDTSDGVRQAAVSAIGTYWREDPDTLGWLRTRATSAGERSGDVRSTAIQMIVAGWHDNPDTELWLHVRGVEDPSSKVRQTIVRALATGWSDDTDTLPWLRGRTVADHHEDVRDAAVRAIAVGWPGDPDTLPLLRQRATDDLSERVRHTAMEAVAAGWHDNDGTLPLLVDRARRDQHQYVRRAAVPAIAAGWHDEAATLPLLHERAHGDPHEFVRRAAVRAIADGWHDDPGTLPLLRTRVTADQREEVRLAAVEAIAAGWHDGETLRLLRVRVARDPHPRVRILLIHAIISGWYADSGTLPLVATRLVEDADPGVRMEAVQALADNWHHDAETSALLDRCAAEDVDADVRRVARAAVVELADRASRA
ncbi:GTPase SAR1 family protein [Allocatelliglobosispora scoriae]|uniref:GTPase SAR1 family protein n=1 Tax=Allocatelliglobosispora scoriae TaxID=643052 RepID=A0A841BJ16_9ACTN|nr:HEAT repeat domain-containing protein [Allocatelliglobosispora scoriae]MBB5869107.1 GTPase SAR1 family protein [Allocatelliglobosispora scoriae]